MQTIKLNIDIELLRKQIIVMSIAHETGRRNRQIANQITGA
jgi:hypothetical protein